jgi:N-methylhydantoinase A
MPLDVEASRAAIRIRIAEPLGITEIEAALAIVKIAVMNMSLAVRQVSVERGYDPRDFAMVAFGGAGPLHAVEVARSLHIPIVIVPNFPGQFSASGMLLANPRHDFVRTYYRPLDRTDFAELKRIAEELESQARERLMEDRVEMSHFLEIRYAGQDFSLPVPVDPSAYAKDYAATVQAAFNKLHRSKFGYHDGDQQLEIVNAHLVATINVGRTSWSAADLPVGSGATSRPVYLDAAEAPIDCAVYQRASLRPGDRIDGPAVIHEYASTTLLFPGDVAQVTESAELIVHLGGAECS